MRYLGGVTAGKVAAALTLVAVVVLSVNAGGSMFSPGQLNAEARGKARRGGVATHAELENQCSACHVPPWSGETMASRCLDCHTDIREQIDAHHSMHGTMSEGRECRSCHTEHKGTHAALTNLSHFDHSFAAFPLTGKHVTVDCKSCHRNDTFKGTSKECASCHAEPKVHQGMYGTNCAQCHSTSTWADFAKGKFNHDLTAFKLSGKHMKVECQACHVNNTFKGTAKDCASCHADPVVHKGRFGTNCAECHSTTTWKDIARGSFNHDLTAFKLSGKHMKVECQACHVNNKFKGTAKDCASCHADPPVHKGRFGTNCSECHSTSTWADFARGTFNHDLAAFKLTGKHKTAECAACHKNDTFKGTAKDCLACHEEPKVHMGKFGTSCVDCHSTDTWKGATFKHKFPLNHGKRKQNIECSTCHTKENDFKVYTCYGCHEHEKTRMERKHKKVTNLDNCARCHPTGREHDRERGQLDLPGTDLCQACPGGGDRLTLLNDLPLQACPGMDRPQLGRLLTGSGLSEERMLDLLIADSRTRNVPVLREIANPVAAPRGLTDFASGSPRRPFDPVWLVGFETDGRTRFGR